MTLDQKINLIIAHAADENFYLLGSVLNTPSESDEDVGPDTVISNGPYAGKTVAAAAFEKWHEKWQNNKDALHSTHSHVIAIQELCAGSSTLSRQAKQSLIVILSVDVYVFERQLLQLSLLLSPSQLWNTILTKIRSLKEQHPNGEQYVSQLLTWMQLDTRKWAAILSNESVKYVSASQAASDSIFNLRNPSDLSMTCAQKIISKKQYADLAELKRQLSVIITYRLKCYITQLPTTLNLSRYVGTSEKKFYQDHLKLWLVDIVEFLCFQHYMTHTTPKENLSWLAEILNHCLSQSYSAEETSTVREVIIKMNLGGSIATKLSSELADLSHEGGEFLYTLVGEIFTQVLTAAPLKPVYYTSSELQAAISMDELSAVWKILSTDSKQRLSMLTEDQRDKLANAAAVQFLAIGSQDAFNILCRFYEEDLSISRPKGLPIEEEIIVTQDENTRDVKLKNQSFLRNLALGYLTLDPENEKHAIQFFAQLFDKKIMFLNSRFNIPGKPTLLHFAMHQGFIEIVNLLIFRDVEPNWLDGNKRTPVECALLRLARLSPTDPKQKNIISGLKMIFNYYKLDWANASQQMPLLMVAIFEGYSPEVFKLMLDSPYCDPMYRYENCTPLFWLIKRIPNENSMRSTHLINWFSTVELFLLHPKVNFYITEGDSKYDNIYDYIMRSEASYGRHWVILMRILQFADDFNNICSSDRPIPAHFSWSYVQDIAKSADKMTFLEAFFKSRLTLTQPYHLGIILQKVKKIPGSPLEEWMELDAEKWSRALSAAGQQYAKDTIQFLEEDTNIWCSRAIQSKIEKPDIQELQRQLQVALEYRLRCYLGNASDILHDGFLSSLLPFVTAFIRESMQPSESDPHNPTWLSTILKTCLNEPLYPNSDYALGQVIININGGPAIREKLRLEFCPEIVQMFTRELNIFSNIQISNEEPDIDGDDSNQKNGSVSTSALQMRRKK